MSNKSSPNVKTSSTTVTTTGTKIIVVQVLEQSNGAFVNETILVQKTI